MDSTNRFYLRGVAAALLLSLGTLNVSAQILGSVTGIKGIQQGMPYIEGWACSSLAAQSTDIDVYLGASRESGGPLFASTQTAVPSSGQQGGKCKGTSNGFRILIHRKILEKHSGQRIFIYGMNRSSGAAYSLTGSGSLKVPELKGVVEGIVLNKKGLAMVSGWACQSGLDAPVNVQLYAKSRDGKSENYLLQATANMRGSDYGRLNQACGSKMGKPHRFLIPLTKNALKKHQGKTLFVKVISKTLLPGRILNNAKELIVPELKLSVKGAAR